MRAARPEGGGMRSKVSSARALAGSDGRLTLFASLGIDPRVCEAIDTLWKGGKARFRAGETLHLPRGVPETDAAPLRSGGGLAGFPGLQGGERMALLLLE